MEKVGFDVDGVFADFHLMACIAMKGKLVRTSRFLEEWIGVFYHGVKKEEAFWERMPTINGNSLEGIVPTCFITTIESEMIDSRKKWLSDKLGVGFHVPVHASSNKIELIEKYDLDFFVDDNPALAKEIRDSGLRCKPIQMVPYYADYEIVDESLTVRSIAEFKHRFL